MCREARGKERVHLEGPREMSNRSLSRAQSGGNHQLRSESTLRTSSQVVLGAPPKKGIEVIFLSGCLGVVPMI